MWEDISKLTKEEMEKRSIPAPLDSEGEVKLTPDFWTEVNGVRFLKKPLIVDFAPWCLYTLDCASLIAEVVGFPDICVIAFSTDYETTDQLGSAFFEKELEEMGYGYLPGFGSEELHSID